MPTYEARPPLAVSLISKQQHGGCQDVCQQRGADEPPYNSARKFGPVLGRRRTKDDFACEEVQVRTRFRSGR